jgi:hypothetical protein
MSQTASYLKDLSIKIHEIKAYFSLAYEPKSWCNTTVETSKISSTQQVTQTSPCTSYKVKIFLQIAVKSFHLQERLNQPDP